MIETKINESVKKCFSLKENTQMST